MIAYLASWSLIKKNYLELSVKSDGDDSLSRGLFALAFYYLFNLLQGR